MGLAVHWGLPAVAAVPSLHTRLESEDAGILHRGVHSGKEESGILNLLVRCTEAGLPDCPCGHEGGRWGRLFPGEKTPSVSAGEWGHSCEGCESARQQSPAPVHLLTHEH